MLTAILNRRPVQVEEKSNLWTALIFADLFLHLDSTEEHLQEDSLSKGKSGFIEFQCLTCILHSGVAAARKRKAPSSTHSVMNFDDLSPETLRRVDKAVKVAALQAPALAAETSRRGRERHAEELRKQVCTLYLLHNTCIKHHKIMSQHIFLSVFFLCWFFCLQAAASKQATSGQASQPAPEVTVSSWHHILLKLILVCLQGRIARDPRLRKELPKY